MKKTLLAFVLLITILNGYSQNRVCWSSIDLVAMQQQDTARYRRFIDLETFTQNYIATGGASDAGAGGQRLSNPNGLIRIPVVVHVLHRGEAIGTGRNISDAQIQSQIDVINEDFKRLNADRVNTPNVFTGVAGVPNYEFVLACIDPNGNATNGIRRVFTTKTSFAVSQTCVNNSCITNETTIGVKFTAQGGDDAWATNRYLNLWTCDFNDGTLGYATFPADFVTNPNVDGVVIAYNAFGRTGTLQANFNLGRTATHEIGHWLNLLHIWGDASCGDDHVGDTPPQLGPNYNCPAFPKRTVTCNNTTNGEMFMNYMDYSNDNCMNLFTAEQTLRGRAIFANGGPRFAFINNYFNIQQPANNIPCTGGYVSLNNLICLTPTWSIVSGNATIASGQSTNKVLITATASGSVVIRATAGNYIDEKTIQIVPPTSTDYTLTGGGSTTQPLYWCPNQTYSFSISGGAASNYVWSIPTGWTSVYNGGYVNALKAPSSTYPPTGTVSVTFTPSCGGGTVTKSFFTAYSSSACTGTDPRFTYSPNPAQSYLNVAVASGYTSTVTIKSIQIIGVSTGITVFDQSYGSGVLSAYITTSGFQTGNYNLRIYDGTAWATYQFVR
jgi:hypothetical protein